MGFWTPESARTEFERNSDLFENENLFKFNQSAQHLEAKAGCWNSVKFSFWKKIEFFWVPVEELKNIQWKKIGNWNSMNQSTDEETNRSEISLSSISREIQKLAEQWGFSTNAQKYKLENEIL